MSSLEDPRSLEVLVVDSYADTPEKREALASTINGLMSLERDICLVSHVPIGENAFNPRVKYAIYDGNNILGERPAVISFKVEDMEVRCFQRDHYHGPAVYANLHNALRLLAGRYERVHFVEPDIDVAAIGAHLDRAAEEFACRPNVQVIGYSFFAGEPARASPAIVTSLFSLKPQIVRFLPGISNWEDYVRLSIAKRLLLEEWFLDRLAVQGIAYSLLGAAPFEDHSHMEGDYLVFKCRQENLSWLVIVLNRSSHGLEIKWKLGCTAELAPASMGRIENLSDLDEVMVRIAGTENVHHHPLKTMGLGAFKKPGCCPCPDWDKLRVNGEVPRK